MKEECTHEDQWRPIGINGVTGTIPRGGGYVDELYEKMVAAIYCQRCGKIKKEIL